MYATVNVFSEKRFSELEKRVNNISESAAGLRGANSIPQKSPNTVLLAILSVLGVAVIWYWGWVGVQVVAQGKKIDGIIALLNPSKVLEDISQLDEMRFAKSLPALQKVIGQPFPQPPPPFVCPAKCGTKDAED